MYYVSEVINYDQNLFSFKEAMFKVTVKVILVLVSFVLIQGLGGGGLKLLKFITAPTLTSQTLM